jgi:O-acetylserine/cysteine efflux transporter
MLILGEQVSLWQWAGVVLVVSALAAALFGDKLFAKFAGVSPGGTR